MKAIFDHLGDQYKSLAEMAVKYDIDYQVLYRRLHAGWDIKEALTTPEKANGPEKAVNDHKGNIYSSVKDLIKAYGITLGAYNYRISKGWPLEKVLTTPVTPFGGSHKPFTDHKGHEFISLRECANAYGIKPSTLESRLNNGWDIERALTEPVNNYTDQVTGPDGRVFTSIAAACHEYHIEPSTVARRMHKGMTFQEAVMAGLSKKKSVVKDHKGNIYYSTAEMARKYGLSRSTYRSRRKRGWTLEEALETELGKTPLRLTETRRKNNGRYAVTAPNGIIYSNFADMCRAYRVKENTVRSRMKRGISLEKALDKDYKKYSRYEVTAPDGTIYPSYSAMAEAYGMSRNALRYRLKNGLPLERDASFSAHSKGGKTCYKTVYDHKGNKYPTKKAMCDYYGISTSVFDYRIGIGWSKEEALTKKDLHRQTQML